MNPVYGHINQVTMEIRHKHTFPFPAPRLTTFITPYSYKTPFISPRTKRTQDVSFVPEGLSYQARL